MRASSSASRLLLAFATALRASDSEFTYSFAPATELVGSSARVFMRERAADADALDGAFAAKAGVAPENVNATPTSIGAAQAPRTIFGAGAENARCTGLVTNR